MAQRSDDEVENRLTKLSAFLFLHTEHLVYALLGGLLAVTAALALLDAAGVLFEALKMVGGSKPPGGCAQRWNAGTPIPAARWPTGCAGSNGADHASRRAAFMKQIVALTVLGLSIGLAGPALAQEPLPLRVGLPEAVLPAGATTSTSSFRAEALRSDAASIESSRLALARSRNRDVRDYARRVIETRRATSEALLPPGTSLTAGGLIAPDDRDGPAGIVLTPLAVATRATSVGLVDGGTGEASRHIALGPQGRARVAQLRATPDAGSFDRIYVAQQTRADARTLALYDGYARGGDSAEGRRFANEALPYIAAEHDRSSNIDLSFDS